MCTSQNHVILCVAQYDNNKLKVYIKFKYIIYAYNTYTRTGVCENVFSVFSPLYHFICLVFIVIVKTFRVMFQEITHVTELTNDDTRSHGCHCLHRRPADVMTNCLENKINKFDSSVH